MKNMIVLSASPVKNGNTALLVGWFAEGAKAGGAEVEVVETHFLKYKVNGCISCRKCQKLKEYECVVDDDAKRVLIKMRNADVIVMATPLYFYGPSAQLKLVMDRMFSLYKWDNTTNAVTTPLKGRKMALIASAYEDIGLDALEQPFVLTAKYTGMPFESLLVPNAGESGDLKSREDVRQKAIEFGVKMAQ